ncbi:MAG: ArgE/DapE family deacylase [Gemmatimonadaceae bacterium]
MDIGIDARIPRGDPIALTQALVAIDSQNPSLDEGGAGEAATAFLLAAVLETWGFAVEMQEAAEGRPNVIARIGKPGGRSLMFNGHMDVVGVSGMTHAPFDAVERDGRIYGRGAADMKSGIAAMCCAALRAHEAGLAGEIIIAAVIDEEFTSLGTQALIAGGVRADAAIVTEPTGLAIMPAHRGFVWIDATFIGRAAHGSRWEIGVDAIRHAGLFLAELDRYDAETLAKRGHPLLGRPSVHASLISGGTERSTYPDRCELAIERRTIPGESADQILLEMQELCDRVRVANSSFDGSVRIKLSQSPSDVATSAPVVRALSAALAKCGVRESIGGMSAWTDAALLNAAGIPAICFGPGDIALAHAAEEFVPVDEIEEATRVLTDLALRWTASAG